MNVFGFIYLLSAYQTRLLKLGWTDNFARRLSQVRRGNADQISVVWVVQGSHKDEREMHRSPDLTHYHEHDEFYRDEPGAREMIFSLLPVGSTPEELPEKDAPAVVHSLVSLDGAEPLFGDQIPD